MSRVTNEDRFDPDERAQDEAYTVPRKTRRRKLWMLVYPRQKRARIGPAYPATACLYGHQGTNIGLILMNSRELKESLKPLTPRDRRGLRIVEVPL